MILTVGLVAMVTLVGCGANNPTGPGALNSSDGALRKPQDARLVGAWSMQTDNVLAPVIVFKIDDAVDVTEDDFPKGPLTISGTYQVDGDKIALRANAVEGGAAVVRILARFTTYTYAIDGNVLTLKRADGEVIRWKKM
jgi:hypothetical protein